MSSRTVFLNGAFPKSALGRPGFLRGATTALLLRLASCQAEMLGSALCYSAITVRRHRGDPATGVDGLVRIVAGHSCGANLPRSALKQLSARVDPDGEDALARLVQNILEECAE